MVKVLEYIKKHRRLIFIILIFILLFSNIVPLNDVQARINSSMEGQETADGGLQKLIGTLLNAGAGVLGSGIAFLMNIFIVLIFVIMYAVFSASGVSNGMFNFPFPDQIVFNKLPFFDPNFINLTTLTNSPVRIAQTVIQNLYYSFFILAGTVFVIAAMIIGIKLAISSIASERAQYKTALVNWLTGLLLLFTVHFIMAGLFYINEEIVEVASNLAADVVVKFNWTDAIPVVGKAITSLINGIASLFGHEESVVAVEVRGFGGIVMMFALKGVLGRDLVSSIACAIILGQTLGLVVTYSKRMFMCILLGIMAPLVVAVDVIQKSKG